MRQVWLFGPLDIHFVFMKFAVGSCGGYNCGFVVKVKRAIPGYSLRMVTADNMC